MKLTEGVVLAPGGVVNGFLGKPRDYDRKPDWRRIKAFETGCRRSALEAERREIGVGIERVHALGLLQLGADDRRDRRHHRFDEHLEDPVGEHHRQERPGAPDADEGERVEDQAVDALADDYTQRNKVTIDIITVTLPNMF